MRPRTWSRLAVAAAGGGTVLLVLVAVGWAPLDAADRAGAAWLHRTAHRAPGWGAANRILTDWVWDPLTMRLLVLAAVVALLLRGAWRPAGWLAATSLAGLVAQHGLKLAVGRRRPEWTRPLDAADGWAFPSGHAMTATVSCGLLLVLALWLRGGSPLWRAGLWTLAVVSVAGAGVTRVVVGVHWPSDVLGGWLFDTAVLAGCTGWWLRGGRLGGRVGRRRSARAAASGPDGAPGGA